MPKWQRNVWEEIPFDQNATPEQKGDEFDRQFEENKAKAEAEGCKYCAKYGLPDGSCQH